MSIIPGVNLPWPVLTYAVGLVFVGLKCTFRPNPPPPGRASEIMTMLGMVTTGIGLSYLVTTYMPMHENQYLYASVPIRLIVDGIAGIELLVAGHRMTQEGFNEVGGTLLIEALAGLWLGWYLETFNGRVPGI
jgi:hypothetical protein